LKGSAGALIETPVGKLQDGAKAKLVDALSQSSGGLELDTAFSNSLRDTVTNQMADDNPNKEYLSSEPDNIYARLQAADGG